jgi:hypothetical protein
MRRIHLSDLMLILFAFVLILADQPDFTAHTPAALPSFIASR